MTGGTGSGSGPGSTGFGAVVGAAAGAPAGLALATSVWLPADRPPWKDTGVMLEKGQWYTVVGSGRVSWTHRDRELWAPPKHHLWGRVGEAPIWNPTQDGTTRRAECRGTLRLGLLHGFWKDRGGELATSERAYDALRGGIEVLILVWSEAPEPGLASLVAGTGDARLGRELERLRDPVPVPEGWSYFFECGFADVYRSVDTPYGPGIAIHSDDDQGILRKPVDFPFGANTRIAWRWKLDEMPSDVAEDRVATHDYVSIAVEFENGRDLTWFWSAALAPETHFGCPVRVWNHREIHYCVRSGREGLGAWQREHRDVYRDTLAALGEDPGPIHHVWLIVLSSFQHRVARATFADVWLEDGASRIRVL